MAENQNDTEKKSGFPGGFFIVLAMMMLAMFIAQGYMNIKVGKVSFSYQLEHLVNLDLIQPEMSRKTAQSDSLVTFSGKFREKHTEVSQKRWRYLSLLHTDRELSEELDELELELDNLQSRIVEASGWYLGLTGESIPRTGFVVVDPIHDTPQRENGVVVLHTAPQTMVSLPLVSGQLRELKRQRNLEEIPQFGRVLASVIRDFRSPKLGIGSEEMKQTLRLLDQEVTQASLSESPGEKEIGVYEKAIEELNGIVAALDVEKNSYRLLQLRSVRLYKEGLEKHLDVVLRLDENRALLDKERKTVDQTIWFFNNQEVSTKVLDQTEEEIYHQWFVNAKSEWDNFEQNAAAFFKAPDQPVNAVLQKKFKSEPPAPNYMNYIFTFLPIVLVLGLLYFLFSRQMKGMGNNAMNFGKSPARLFHEGETNVTFKDVAGIDEAEEELYEIVDFLKNPEKYTSLGGRIPKGVLCVGPPGTGKTLIARAVAGEAERPFFSISGSDFVEMFVGVGASRIRDMFEQAKKNAPCIIFIDEIDAVGRHRGSGHGGGHDEREQTLNQLLVEMDGFDARTGVILMAATNRPDVLDKALLRPGRFDRQVMIDLPDIQGRYEILKVHARRVKLDETVDLMEVARGTPGSSGADLENILNEAALAAARKGRSVITAEETREARDKVIYGKERRSLQMDEREKLTTAFHESGHAIAGLVVEHSDPVDKVTIIPRGHSLGATHFLPEKNKLSYWKKELRDKLIVLMGGRVAEGIFLDDFSSGAQQDISQATQLARSMVCQWGMSEKVGIVTHDDHSEGGRYLGMQQAHDRKYSEKTAELIDSEVKQIVQDANDECHRILTEHKEHVQLMTDMLMEFESLDREDCLAIIEGKWDVEDKRRRMKEQEEAHKMPVTSKEPPPLPETVSEHTVLEPKPSEG